MNSNTATLVVTLLVAVIGAGGIAAIIKAPKENARIIVDAAQGAVVVQSGVLQDVQRRLDDVEERARQAEQRAMYAEQRAQEAETRLQREISRALAAEQERDRLRHRVESLERKVAELEANGHGPEGGVIR
jgi:tetrahydromethanopterin S-methyltransferase subunit G